MGQKVNPIGIRVGVIKDWDSKWIADKKDIAKYILEDNNIRKFVNKKYNNCSLSKINIERNAAGIIININTARPGMMIGMKGAGIEILKEEIKKLTDTKQITINIVEVKRPDVDSLIVADSVAKQLEKRANWRRTMKQAIQKTMRAGAKGIKIMVSGRLDGAEMARSEFYIEGNLPLQTIRADIDYGTATARTGFGAIGVKVWIYKGEVLGKKEVTNNKEGRQ